MVKKITRKKALSLALAGLMLAPSLPIQSFAQGANQGAKVESGTNKNGGPLHNQSKQYIWGKYNVSKTESGEPKLGDIRSFATNGNYGVYKGIGEIGGGFPGIKVDGYLKATIVPGNMVKLSQPYQKYFEASYGGPVSGELPSTLYTTGADYIVDNDAYPKGDYFSPEIRMHSFVLADISQVEVIKNGRVTVSKSSPNAEYLGDLYRIVGAEEVSSKSNYIEDVTAPKGTYPNNGEKDGFWYVLKGEAPTDPTVNTAKSESDDDIKGAIENLPEGAKVDIVSKPERTAYTPEIKELTVKPGEKADLTQAVTNPKAGVKIVEKTAVDTSKVGKQTGAITVILPAETKNAKAKITFKDQTTKEVDVPVEFKELSKDYDVTVNVKETAVKVTLNYVDEFGKTVATKEMSAESGSKIKLADIPELFGFKLLSTDDITVSEDGQAVTVKVKDLNAEIKSLEDQLNAKKGELSKLEEQLAAEKAKGEQDTAKIAELEKAINDKKAEIDKLNKQIGDLDEVIKQLQEKLNGLKGNLEAANKELAKSKNDLENLKKELEAKITDLNGQIADKDAKGKDLEKQLADEKAKGDQDATKIAELEKAIKDNNDAKDALNKEKEGLAKELADKEAKIAELEANAKKLEGNVKDLEAKIKDLISGKAVDAETMKALQDQLEKAKAENQKLADNLSALEKAIAEKEAEIGKLNDKVGSQSELIKALQAKLDEMKKDLEEANKNLLDSKSNLDNLKKELADKIAALNDQIAGRDAKGKDLEKQLADEKAKGNQDTAKIAELEKAIKDNNDAKDALNKEKEGLAKELAEKEAKIAELEANAKKLEGNVKDLEAKIKDLIDGKSVDASALKKAEEALAQAKADNAKLADEVKKLQDSLKTEKTASAEKDKELSKLREEAKANHDSNLSELKKELKKELDRADKVDRKRLSEQENKKLDEAIKKAKDIFAKKDAKDDEVKQAIKDLKETLKPYENFIFDDKHINGLLGKNIKSLKDFIDKVEKAIGGTLIEEETISKDGEYTALKYVFMIDSNKYAQATNKDTKIYKMDVSPFIRNSRTMLPLRYVANVLGADVKWDHGTRTATFTKDGMEAKINIDEGKTIKVGGKSVELSAKPEIVQDRIFVPLTDISKVFEVTNGNTDDGINQDIEWNKDNRTVTVHIAR